MPTDSTRLHPARLWPTACVLLGLGSATLWGLGFDDGALAWNATTWRVHPWVLWTASLVHPSGAHLAGNLAALGVLAVLGVYLNAGRAAVLGLLAGWPLGTLVLAFWPAVTGYSGLSGLLCAMLGVLWSHAALHTGTRAVSWALLVPMALKLLTEHAWSQPVGYDPNWGANVVYVAHLGGFVCGALCGWLASRHAGRTQARA